MFLDFFYLLRKEGIKASLHEYLTLLEALDRNVVEYSVEEFYVVSKTIFVKGEEQLDRFDKVFGAYFRGKEYISNVDLSKVAEEWLRKNSVLKLTDEEKALIEAMGGHQKMMERLRELLAQQKERHEGGNRWIGTGGTSPFGANGYNPEGYRMGQAASGARSAIKVWDRREFANLDDKQELNTRNIKLALKRLRVFTREGSEEELDIDDTINRTSRNAGMLDIAMIPSKENRVKVLLFIDIGGSMDDHIELCTQLFSAARHELKHLEFYYFHNCIYNYVWKDNDRRWDEKIPVLEVLHKYNKDYKVIFLGDAAMSPYELVSLQGSVEFSNDEAGIVWMNRIKDHFPFMVWLNPTAERNWSFFQSTNILREFMDYRMFPTTLEGITQAMKCLKNKKMVNNSYAVK